ncbi:MAG: helix-hairpin-helix domain-containing protein [Nitrospirae bacterium]|nr:helix-hairpin-helix domain-containing protein [Nitrospirota bacterium]
MSKVVLMAFVFSLIAGSIAFAGDQDTVKIDINKATVNELAKLPGIGKKKAEAIVAYRNEKGKFNSVDDLKKIDGIGAKTFEKIKEHLAAEKG